MRSLDLKLPSGIVFRDAVALVHATFERWPWELHDDTPPRDVHAVTKADIARVYQFGDRTSRTVYEDLIDAQGAAIAECLQSIPPAALEAVDLDAIHDPVVELFDRTVGFKAITLASATRLLHPFRPSLFAVLDPVVENYYWYATSIRDERRFRRMQDAGCGAYVFEMLALLQADVRGARAEIDRVLAACEGRPYANLPRVGVVESLLAGYYAWDGPARSRDGD